MWLVAILAVTAFLFAPFKSIDTAFKPYVDEYLTIVNKECKSEQLHWPHKIIIEFVNRLEKDNAAQCSQSRGFIHIEVSREHWDESVPGYDLKKQMIFHELSHCVLLLDHVDNYSNYMYYRITLIEKGELEKQLQQDAQNKCKTK